MTGLALRPCIETLLIAYPFFLAAGVSGFRHFVKNKPHADAKRNKALTVLRFLIYVMLMPPGVMIACVILGWLDPLYHFVKQMRL